MLSHTHQAWLPRALKNSTRSSPTSRDRISRACVSLPSSARECSYEQEGPLCLRTTLMKCYIRTVTFCWRCQCHLKPQDSRCRIQILEPKIFFNFTHRGQKAILASTPKKAPISIFPKECAKILKEQGSISDSCVGCCERIETFDKYSANANCNVKRKRLHWPISSVSFA